MEKLRRRWAGSLAREIPQELKDALNDQVGKLDLQNLALTLAGGLCWDNEP